MQPTQAYESSQPAASTQFSHHQKQKSDRLWISAKAWLPTSSAQKHSPGQVDVWQAASRKARLRQECRGVVVLGGCLECIERQLHQQGYSSMLIEQRRLPSVLRNLSPASHTPSRDEWTTSGFPTISALSTPKTCKEIMKQKSRSLFPQAGSTSMLFSCPNAPPYED